MSITAKGTSLRTRPARRRRGRILTLGLAVSALAGAALPAAAEAGTTNLGTGGFGSIAVSDATHEIFVSLPTANTVDVLNFQGALVASIPNIYGAWGLTIGHGYVYVTESTTGHIMRINLGSLTPETVASGLNNPLWLVMTGNRLWTTSGPSAQAKVVSVDPASGARTTVPGTYYEPDLAVSPGDPSTLFIAEDGLSPGAVYRFNVATSPATRVAANTFTDQKNIRDLVVSSDGKRLIPASGWPDLFEELSAKTLRNDGPRYPGNPYPAAVAVSASGLLATGLDGANSAPDLAVFRLGFSTPVFTATTNDPNGAANVIPHGLALSADGQSLFAITQDGSQGLALHTFTLPRSSVTSVSCLPSTVSPGQSSTCTATVTGIGSGTTATPTGTVQFTTSKPGAFVENPCALSGSGITASCHVSFRPAARTTGADSIAAVYGGDGAHSSSAASTTLTVR